MVENKKFVAIRAHEQQQQTGLFESHGDSRTKSGMVQAKSSQTSPKPWFQFASKAIKDQSIQQFLEFFDLEKDQMGEICFYVLLQL